MKELLHRDYVIAAHAVPVGASSGVRYAYLGEILPATPGVSLEGLPERFESDVNGDFINAATALEACLADGKRIIDARLDGGTAIPREAMPSPNAPGVPTAPDVPA